MYGSGLLALDRSLALSTSYSSNFPVQLYVGGAGLRSSERRKAQASAGRGDVHCPVDSRWGFYDTSPQPRPAQRSLGT